jgi:hypothetical protein
MGVVPVVTVDDHKTLRRQRNGNIKNLIQRADHDSAPCAWSLVCGIGTPRADRDVPECAITIKTEK